MRATALCGATGTVPTPDSASGCFAIHTFAEAIDRTPGSFGWYTATLAPIAKNTSIVQTMNPIT